MISIGNDIVALSVIDKQRSNDIRFHSKFISPVELTLYQHSGVSTLPFECFVWLLWSVKESAYKYQKRLEPALVFSPTKIITGNIDSPDSKTSIIDLSQINTSANSFYTGGVFINRQTLYFKAIINDQIIAVIVNNEPSFQNIHWGIQQIHTDDNETQSHSVRVALLDKLKIIFPQGDVSLQTSKVGYPILLFDNKDSNIPVSISHHHLFTSYCFKLKG